MQQKFDMCSIVEREHRSRKGGFGALQHALHETRDRIAATRGGQEYKKHVQRCQVCVAGPKLLEETYSISAHDMVNHVTKCTAGIGWKGYTWFLHRKFAQELDILGFAILKAQLLSDLQLQLHV